MARCLNNMYEEIKLCVSCDDNEMLSFVTQSKGIR